MNGFKWLLVLALLATPIGAQSYYPLRLDDPKAVYLAKENFPRRYRLRSVGPLPADDDSICVGRNSSDRIWSDAAGTRAWREDAGLHRHGAGKANGLLLGQSSGDTTCWCTSQSGCGWSQRSSPRRGCWHVLLRDEQCGH